MNTWKPNMEETKRHYIDWWNHKGIVLNMWEHFQDGVTPHADIPAPPAPKDLNQKWFDPQWRADYLDWYVAHSSLMADMLPVANTQLGPGSLAAILGGVFEGGEDTIWIHPDPNYTDEIRFDENHPNWLLHKELLKACKEKSQGHYYVGMPDLMEGLDVLAAMKGTDKVLLDTVMQPEVLEHQMQQINDIYFRVFNELYDIIREGDEMAFCYFSAWAPGTMSKLQSDISTMISEDDYRRFVQPFIREQCQHIDYTLYHLDGVGAMHHLPSLLEIKELNAIQWTPGVGQPQGGSSKWYDLYRKILEGGKSIMACWVTLDELRPLLDNIGGDGIHLEMDFHNEQEVEQAMKIIDDFKTAVHIPSKPSPNSSNREGADTIETRVQAIIEKVEYECSILKQEGSGANIPLAEAAAQRVLVLDGAMGTMIQRYRLREEDFRGYRFARHSQPLMGCNDLLSMTCPVVIRDIHHKYLEAGADIIETNTFNAQRISLADYGLEDQVRDINLAACQLAREEADAFATTDKPRYVLGSIGPTAKTTSMSTGKEPPLDKAVLKEAYREQIDALVDGGVDGLLIETIFDVENARVAIEAAQEVLQKKGKQLPISLSFSVSTPDGHNMLGQSIFDFLDSLHHQNSGLFSVGINCYADVREMIPLIQCLGTRYKYLISAYPNAGMPDGKGNYNKTPEQHQQDLWPMLDAHLLNIVGGCCGTTDQFIAKIAELVQPAKGCFMSPKRPSSNPPQREGADTPKNNFSIPDKPSLSATNSNHSSPVGKAVVGSVSSSIIAGNAADCAAATKAAVEAGASPQDIINGEMIAAMSEVGQRFQDGKAFVPQLLMAGRAMKAGLEVLKPLMAGEESTSIGKVVIGTVKGDLHDIGKNLVASMLEGCGFEVINIGIDVSADRFIEEVKKNQPDILCMSALLTTTMGYMKEVIDALEAAGIRDRVKVMVGGAPVSQVFADEIGADGYSDNANSAVQVAKQLLNLS